jgi:hypothetical protein
MFLRLTTMPAIEPGESSLFGFGTVRSVVELVDWALSKTINP